MEPYAGEADVGGCAHATKYLVLASKLKAYLSTSVSVLSG